MDQVMARLIACHREAPVGLHADVFDIEKALDEIFQAQLMRIPGAVFQQQRVLRLLS
jgi:hypothetical protein